MKTAEIRKKFLNYFKDKGHQVVESSPLVPQNDPTLLFTNAGMVQFKDVFTGQDRREYSRATTSQKCVRAGGKHNDLENVGLTARHHTFFEMLGNFSFGDYFKPDAIRYAWEFTTQVLGLDKKDLYVTVFNDDDEAAEIWEKQEGVPADRIRRFGEKDNFWAMGDTGPCGPCSELFIDRGKKYGCGGKECDVGCECDRFVEFWNLVFMQFNRDESGKLTPLPKPSVDTGAGLERLAAILQDKDSNYETDAFEAIIAQTAQLAKVKYEKKNQVSFRVIADHARATTFLIGDGVLPSNEGRGYVLRRIMRRAIRHGTKLGFKSPFLYRSCQFVIDQMSAAFPDLRDKKAFIQKAVKAEEEQFFKTLDRGLDLLAKETKKLGGKKILPGEIAFKLYDTYGFPVDLTRVILAEKGIGVDERGFEKSMAKQRAESRKHWKGSGEEAVDPIFLNQELKIEFVGYDETAVKGKCLAIFEKSTTGLQGVKASNAKELWACFSPTPFYGESGGQVGDKGLVQGPGFEGRVVDVQKPVDGLIVAQIQTKKGKLEKNKSYEQLVHNPTRAFTARNHTATHLLHWALHEVLGDHVKQAGSLVNEKLLRFDFTHFNAMTPEEITRIEDLINQKIWAADPVSKKEMSKDKAIAAGAIAFFGEKYGKRVRVVKVGDYSTELCGGTHIENSSEISLFKIVSEQGIAAGVRRIQAYTSERAFSYLREKDQEIKKLRDRLKASSDAEILPKVDRLFATEKQLRKEIEGLESRAAGGQVDSLVSGSKAIGGASVITSECKFDEKGIKYLRDLSDQIKQKRPDSVMVLGMGNEGNGKAFLLASRGPQAPQEFNASEIIKNIAPLIEGRGGGKPDLAQAGGSKPGGLKAALAEASKLLSEQLS